MRDALKSYLALATGAPLVDMMPILAIFSVALVRLVPSVSRIASSVNSLRLHAPSVRAVTHRQGGDRRGEEPQVDPHF